MKLDSSLARNTASATTSCGCPNCPAPWQAMQWIEQIRQQLRPNHFLRMIENTWVTNEETFVPMEWWELHGIAVGQKYVRERTRATGPAVAVEEA
jgi:hypothetical protein